MAEPSCDEEWLLPCCDQVSNVSMSQIMEPDARQPASGDAPKHLREALRVERLAIGECEHKAVVHVAGAD